MTSLHLPSLDSRLEVQQEKILYPVASHSFTDSKHLGINEQP